MGLFKKNLGKVSLTAEGKWDINKEYNILSIVFEDSTTNGYISKKYVPAGIEIDNEEYWMLYTTSGKSPYFTIGKITTIPSNQKAVVEIIQKGLDENNVPTYELNFSLPKGEKGDSVVFDPTPIYFEIAKFQAQIEALIANQDENLNLLFSNFIEFRDKSSDKINAVVISGEGDKYLTNDGTYKEIPVSTSVYVLNYRNVNQQSFVELTDAINKNKIIILNNIPFSYFIKNTIFEVSSVSNNKIKLTSTKVVQTIHAGDPNKANLDICIINVTINSNGTASYTYQDTFIHNVGDGTKFLSDDGTYKKIDTSNKQDKILLINHENTEIDTTITPNAFHVWGEMKTLSIQFDNTLEDEFNEYLVRFSSGSTPTRLILPKNISWASPIDIKSNKTYELSVIGNYGRITEFDTYHSTISFTFKGTTYQADYGMTWENWVYSDYNVDGYQLDITAVAQEPVVFVREESSGTSKKLYYIGHPDTQTWVLADDVIIHNMDYIEVSASHGFGG